MQWNSSSSGGGGSGGGRFVGGRSSRGGGRFGGRNTSGGGRFGGRDPSTVNQTGEQALIQTCSFYARNTCRNGDSCRFKHAIHPIFRQQAHKAPIKSLAVMHAGDSIKILAGSSDTTVTVWNLGTDMPSAEATLQTTGRVTHVEVKDSTVLWAVDEPVAPDQPEPTVGTVHLLNNNDLSTIAVKRSDDMPYTSPFGEIRSFTVAVMEGGMYLITGGGEGIIRTWKFDPAQNKFEVLTTLEGHLRAVTSLLMQDNLLWSASVDTTIRVWDLGTGRCLGTLASANHGSGHNQAVACLCAIPASAANAEPYVASGGADSELKIWKTNGEFVHSVTHASPITSMAVFQDAYNGVPSLVIGLANGWINIRACSNMALILALDSSIYSTQAIWSIKFLGKSCFAAGGEDGQLIIWNVDIALSDKA